MLPARGTNQIKSGKVKNAEAHTAPTKYGMGDYYGTGFKAPIGRIRDSTVGYRPVDKEQLKSAPRSLA